MSKVLIIDDERPTLALFKLVLEELGHQALTAESGELGLEIFESESPQIVLTDLKMPGLDGLEVLRRIKAKSPATEVIVVTGHGDIELALSALNAEATDFIDKPVRQEALALALRRAEERLAMAETGASPVRLEHHGQADVVSLSGAVTMRAEPALTAAFRESAGDPGRALVLSFDRSATVDCAGMAVLTQILVQAGKSGRRIALAMPSAHFRQVFELVGLAGIAPVRETVEQALAALDLDPPQG